MNIRLLLMSATLSLLCFAGVFAFPQQSRATRIILPTNFTIPNPNNPCAVKGVCTDNVLFLPGIEGSRLYEGIGCGKSKEEKLWEPASSIWNAHDGDAHVGELALNTKGKSVCTDIYTKQSDLVGGIYTSFENEMNKLKSTHVINDWKPVSYDWRLSLTDLLANGTEQNGKIFYEEATSTPYIEQTLRALAASSKTGKVTIIAHSNGGLVAKAILAKLGDKEATKLVDRVIMVAVPQSGAPSDIGSLLVGYNAGIYVYGIRVVSNQAARTFMQNSPMAYHLLPSEDYLESTLPDVAHPVIKFEGTAYTKEEAVYGATIANRSALDNFLLAKEGGRKQAVDNDLKSLKIVNPILIAYANREHDELDSWKPPAGIEVDQIAGWGVDTVQGIDLYSQWSLFGPKREYRPITIEDGDGTVTVPSALEMASSTNVKRFWIDLSSHYKETRIKRSHANLFEIPQLQKFIKNLIENSTSTLPSYILSSQPSPNSLAKKLTFFLHSPLTLQVTDSSGRVTGIATDGTVTQNIPGSTYDKFGEVKYVTVPEGSAYHLTMHGQTRGTFSLDMQESQGSTVTSLSTIANVPTTKNTLANLTISGGINTASPLTLDENGDGHIITVVPHIGRTVFFDITPPEAKIGFSTTTKKIQITGIDETSTTTITTTATTTTITDQAGNWLTINLAKKPNYRHDNFKHKRHSQRRAKYSRHKSREIYHQKSFGPGFATLTIYSLHYSTRTTTSATTSLRYFWNTNRRGAYTTFISNIKTPTKHVIAVYNKHNNKTYVISFVYRNDKMNLRSHSLRLLFRRHTKTYKGLYIPSVVTKQGGVQIN